MSKLHVDIGFSPEVEQTIEEAQKLEDLKKKLVNTTGSPYGLSVGDAVAILLCENKYQIKKILKKYK